jgi:succinate dehydrogenase/fumarate reductase flavoprotein subunit
MAERVGAALKTDLAQAACWTPVSCVPQRGGTSATIPHLIDRQKPGFIAVTRHGHRFVNEASSYHDFGQGMLAACASDTDTCAYLIADHRALRKYGMGGVKPAPLPFAHHLRSGYLMRADTIEALAARAGIDPAELSRTVAEFNRHAERGEDPEFGKGSNIYNRYNGDPGHAPNPCVAPLIKPPYYAMKLYLGELGTLAGLATDVHARVLDAHGRAIPGLYAAGNDAANVMCGDYMSGGSTLGPGMVFGYLAAQHAALGAAADAGEARLAQEARPQSQV